MEQFCLAVASIPVTGFHRVRFDRMNTGSDEIRGGSTVAEEPPDRGLGSRAPAFIKASRPLHISWRVGVFIVGLAVVVGGVFLLPLPGPGWLVIFGGMAIWATEFVWAQLVLRWTKRKVAAGTRRALDPRVRRRSIVLTATALVVVAVLIWVYAWRFGFGPPW
jgi:uncharacterized protein (TIGR02611 family)